MDPRANQRYLEGEGGDKKTRLVVGCVPIDIKSRMVCLIQRDQLKHPGEWIFPKGGWEFGESEIEGAKREVMEEAGLLGDVTDMIGEKLFHNDVSKRSTYWKIFIMHVTDVLDDWPEKSTKERRWFTMDDAVAACGDRGLEEWIRKAFEMSLV